MVTGLNFEPEVTGIAPYTTGMARGLAAAGFDVEVLTARPHYPEWRPRVVDAEDPATVAAGIRVRRVRHYVPAVPSWARRLLSEVSFGLSSVVRRWHRPDVVVAVSPGLMSTGVAALRWAALPRSRRPATVVVVQDLYSRGVVEAMESGRSVQRATELLERMVLDRFDRVVVIHERFRQHVCTTLGLSPEKVHVIPNWTHTDPAPEFDVDAFRASRGWGAIGEEVVVLHAGAMGYKQDLGIVVEAGRVVDEQRLPMAFHLVGDGSCRADLESDAHGVDSVSFASAVGADEFPLLLAAADVLLVHERAELSDMCVPSKLTSYFRAGRPVIAVTAQDSATAHEVAASGGGVRVDPGDPTLLVEAVLDLARTPERAADLGRAGSRFAEERLDRRAATDAYVDVVAQLIEGPEPVQGAARPLARDEKRTA